MVNMLKEILKNLPEVINAIEVASAATVNKTQ